MKIYKVTVETPYSADDAFGSTRWYKEHYYFLKEATAKDFKKNSKVSFLPVEEIEVNEN